MRKTDDPPLALDPEWNMAYRQDVMHFAELNMRRLDIERERNSGVKEISSRVGLHYHH